MLRFKKGDLVQLKSGGPPMTVDEPLLAHNFKTRVKWFAGAKMDSADVDPEALQSYVLPEKKP
jgi:uncharacterized protein YodC (DUF2158 family)